MFRQVFVPVGRGATFTARAASVYARAAPSNAFIASTFSTGSRAPENHLAALNSSSFAFPHAFIFSSAPANIWLLIDPTLCTCMGVGDISLCGFRGFGGFIYPRAPVGTMASPDERKTLAVTGRTWERVMAHKRGTDTVEDVINRALDTLDKVEGIAARVTGVAKRVLKR